MHSSYGTLLLQEQRLACGMQRQPKSHQPFEHSLRLHIIAIQLLVPVIVALNQHVCKGRGMSLGWL